MISGGSLGLFRRLAPPLGIAALGACLILPGLGQFGLWEPWELRVADQAAALAGAVTDRQPVSWVGSPLILPALGIHLFGPGEAAARLPGALVAVATLLAVGWAALVLYGRRAAGAAALVLVAMPLFSLQARQLTSSMPLLLASALSLGGLARLGNQQAGRGPWSMLAVATGLALGALSGGVLVGVVVPGLGFAAAWLVSGVKLESRAPWLLALAVTLGGVAVGLAALLTSYRSGQGSWLLGGTLLAGPSGRSFETVLRVVGFGLYPFGGLAACALLAPLASRDLNEDPGQRRRRFSVLFPLFIAVFGLAAATIQLKLIGEARLGFLPAIAVALGGLLASGGTDAHGLGRVSPVLGLAAASGTLLQARDLWHAPAELLSVHLPSPISWPTDLPVGVFFLAPGVLCAAAVLVRFTLAPIVGPTGRIQVLASGLRRAALPVLLASAVLFSAGLAHGVVPALSGHLSQKRLHDSFRMLSTGGRLALYRVPRSGSGHFGNAEASSFEIGSVDELAAKFRTDVGLFAVIPRAELASLDDAFAATGTSYAVVDDSSSRFLLLAARLPDGQMDKNPLLEHRFRPGATQSPPWGSPRIAVTATYGGAVELLGADFPPSMRRPGSFPLVLYFRVLQRPPPGYKIFVHVERAGSLVHGDHAPLAGTFPTERWRAGDLLRDKHLITVPLVTAPAGLYTIFVGFWPGGNTVRRLPVTAGAHDGLNRTALGTIAVR